MVIGNGRRIRSLAFGGCLLHGPLASLRGHWRIVNVTARLKLHAVHTFGEIFQTLEILRGNLTIPPLIRTLGMMSPELAPARPRALQPPNIDVVFVQPCSPIEIRFRGFAVNRHGVASFLRRVTEGGAEVDRMVRQWVRLGLVEGREDVRAELGARILSRIAGDAPESDAARELIETVTTSPSDIGGGFAAIKSMFACPVVAVSYIFRYMPDGRPIDWPAGFREQVLLAAHDAGLPVYEATRLVQQHGVAWAMNFDQSHYTPEFEPIVGEEMIAFAEEVCGRRSAPGSHEGHQARASA